MQIELKYPVTIGDKTITSVTLRRAKAKDMRIIARHGKALGAVAAGQAEGLTEEAAAATIAMVASMTDLTEAIVDEFDVEDLNHIGEKIGDFFPNAALTTSKVGG